MFPGMFDDDAPASGAAANAKAQSAPPETAREWEEELDEEEVGEQQNAGGSAEKHGSGIEDIDWSTASEARVFDEDRSCVARPSITSPTSTPGMEMGQAPPTSPTPRGVLHTAQHIDIRQPLFRCCDAWFTLRWAIPHPPFKRVTPPPPRTHAQQRDKATPQRIRLWQVVPAPLRRRNWAVMVVGAVAVLCS